MPSAAAAACWAKSRNGGRQWMSVSQHSADAADIAALLWDHWLPRAVRRRIAQDLEDPSTAKTLVRLLAYLHDLGKISPAFASDVPALLPRMASAGLVVSDGVRGRRHKLPHALAGGLALRAWLMDRAGWSTVAANALAGVIGGHHGHPPSTLSEPVASSLLGDGVWDRARANLIEAALDDLGAWEHLDSWGRRPPGEAAQVLMSAVVIVADWLASNSDLFPYNGAGGDDTRAERAWSQLRLPAPWAPAPGDPHDPAFWTSRFDWPSDALPRPVQVAVCDVLSRACEPRLLIVEASMGEGKTEAGQVAAELLAVLHGSGGVMVALPTMATGNGMFPRLLQWLDRLPPAPDGQTWSTYLAHSKARLNDDFRGLHEGRISGVGVDDPDQGGAAVAHAWLSGRKKGVLSSFVVGTIDQVLVGALRTKHLALRHLALAGKVVIIDEVHAADEYMSVYLRGVLAWLGEYGVPTILLSATLPPDCRHDLVTAYLSSRQPRRRRRNEERREGTRERGEQRAGPEGYPLLTMVDGERVEHHVVPSSDRGISVSLVRQDDATLVKVLQRELHEGGTAAVVCNTVSRAQQRARELRGAFGDDVLLVHSRFMAGDRQALESRVRAALGPPGAAQRPSRFVVVGTQVLEQSLDIDVDLLVTDLAPVDLVLQRLGRLHRHDRPERLREPTCLITGVEDWSVPVPDAASGSQRVYGAAALLRAVAVLRPFLDGQALVLPDHIAPLVRDAYRKYEPDDTRWPSQLADAEREAAAQRRDREARASAYRLRMPGGYQTLLGWLDGGRDEESVDGQAAVRDGLQGVEVLLLERRGGVLRIPSWMPAGGTVLDAYPDDGLARAALACAVRLPDYLTAAAQTAEAKGELAAPASWASSPWLRNVLVLGAEARDGGLRAQFGAHVHYDRQEGLIVTGVRP